MCENSPVEQEPQWDRNDRPAASMKRILTITGTLVGIALISLTMAYFGPNHSETWTQRFDRLETRNVPPGTGYLIEAFRAILFLWMTVYIVGTRFTTIIRQIFSFWIWSIKLAVSRIVIFATIAFFVISESQRHLSLEKAPSDMLRWAQSYGLETTLKAEQISYAWYLPYSLVSYIVVFGGLFAFPFFRFWLSDFPYMQRQAGRFAKIQSTISSPRQLQINQRRFAHENSVLSRRYVDLLGILCVGVQYEYWIGQFTLSDAGMQTAAIGWFVVAFAAVFVFAIGATYSKGLAASEDVANKLEHSSGNIPDQSTTVGSFLKKTVASNLGGMAALSMTLVGIHAAAKQHSPERLAMTFELPEYLPLSMGARVSTSHSATRARGERRLAPTTSTGARKLSSLQVLSIGVSECETEQLKLDFAESDAVALATTLQENSSNLFCKVKPKVLVNEDANRNGILLAFKELQTAATQDDLVIISVAGHGITDAFDDFFLLPYDYDPESAVGSSAIPRDSFERWIGRMPCLAWVVLDTCNSRRVTMASSRGFAVNEVKCATQKAVKRFKESQAGVVIMAGSMSGQSSLEKADWGTVLSPFPYSKT